MSSKTTRRRQGFLEKFRLDDAYMLKPDRKAGRPGIYGGLSPEGDAILVKVWPRTPKVDDSDLEEIWRHELRQLQRLAGYPGATEHITHLLQAGKDNKGFYLVLDPGQRRPLATVLQGTTPGHWLRQPRQTRNRALIWRNLKRISLALETLHAQGLLHRNIDHWAILTAGDDTPDFVLTGFEWSMRIVGVGGPAERSRKSQPTSGGDASFVRDWLLFGLLAADLLGVDRGRLLASGVPNNEVADHMAADEIRLLRGIVQFERLSRLDGEIVAERIDEILGRLAAEIAEREPRFHLVVRSVGGGSNLAERIRAVSGGDIEADDVDAQLEFVRADLSESPMLLAIWQDNTHTDFRLALRGHHLIYQVRQYRDPKSETLTWDFAYSDAADAKAPVQSNLAGFRELEGTSIEIVGSREASQRYANLRGKLRSWQNLRDAFQTETRQPSAEEQMHRALTLTQFLEALYAATEIYPVTVSSPDPRNEDGAKLRLRSRPEPDRDDLSKALGLKPSANRLEEALTGDTTRSEGWILTATGTLGDKDPNVTRWQFEVPEMAGGRTTYVFTGEAPAPVLGDAFLIPEGSVGRDVQFRRRLKALRALKDHRELLSMLADPRGRIQDSHDPLIENEAFQSLDTFKQQALREINSTIPFYLVQGPPGVGKTRLVRDLTHRRFAEEPTTRMLLTAQSNAAVDHLMDELSAVIQGDPVTGPLVVRCRAKESDDEPSRFEIVTQSNLILRRLAKSPLAADAPPGIKRLLGQLVAGAEGTEGGKKGGSQPAPAQSIRAFEAVVVRAANIVFATTNSGDLERLIEERSQFDWAIVEEAGKATGGELISPLLLSYRRLMIGDHKQLPPFGSDKIKELLANHQAVQSALLIGEGFVGRALRDGTTDEILDDIEEDEDALPDLCARAIRAFTLFETLIEEEFKRQEKKSGIRPIAKKLASQHRMDKPIADLVSECFYEGKLESHPDCVKRYETERRPILSADPEALPMAPIVVVDMPYLQATMHMKQGDRLPRWHNPDEVEAVVDVLEALRANPAAEKPPSLAVLSPYGQQVRRLREAIRSAGSRLSHLDAFDSPLKPDAFCGTVDSFQGSEADIVVISLVRNNQHGTVRGALGFLSDFRRMNVLLSRARWQLVLVGSMEFLSTVAEASAGTKTDDILFMRTMLAELEKGKLAGSVRSVLPKRSPGEGP